MSTRRAAEPARSVGRPDALQVLIADHETVSDLFDEFESLGARSHSAREQVVAKIVEELSVHAGIEEAVFYPAVRERFANSDEPMVLEALEEHHLVKLTLSELQSMSSDSERYEAKVTVLREVVDHHVDEEETELFPKVRRAFSASELVEMGQRLDDARAMAPKRAHPSAPDTPPGNLVANVLVAPLDAATNLTQRAAGAVRDLID
jgi:hemerythrin superfamily protein